MSKMSKREYERIRCLTSRETLLNSRIEAELFKYKFKQAKENSKSNYDKMQELANKVLEENRVKVEKESKEKELLKWAKMIVKDKEEDK